MRGRDAAKGEKAGEGVVAGDEGAILEMVGRKVIYTDDPPSTHRSFVSVTTSLHQIPLL